LKPAVLALNSYFLIQIILNRQKRKEVEERLKAKNKGGEDLEGGNAFTSMMSSTGLTTVFNALT
jgi:hypothetical protein